MSEAARDLAMWRFRLIQPYLEQKRNLQLVASDAKICFRTAQRWVSQYRKLGLVALVCKSREDRGARRVVSAKIKAAIEGLALERPPLPIRSICRQVRQFAQATGEPLPRYGTVYDLVREIPSGLLTLAQHGSKAYGEGFDLVHRREAPRSNAIWQADHAQLSILLVREDGEIARPWLTIVIDDYSRAIAGYYLGFDPPSSMRTALALRQCPASLSGRGTRIGTSAAFQKFFIPTTAPISLRNSVGVEIRSNPNAHDLRLIAVPSRAGVTAASRSVQRLDPAHQCRPLRCLRRFPSICNLQMFQK